MKKRLLVFALLTVVAFSFPVSAKCSLDVEMINQDPYPALPGDYVKVVFQLTGIDNPECGKVNFDVAQDFPFSLDPGVKSSVEVDSGVYARRFQSSLTVPYKLRIDEEALDGDNVLEVAFYSGDSKDNIIYKEDFNVNVEDSRTDFEVTVKDFNSATNTLTFQILNIGENDVQALTIDIPKQETIIVKGSSRNIVGDLDSNDDTTFNFEAVPVDGAIAIDVSYTDSINVRRTLRKTVSYDSSYFVNRKADEKQSVSVSTYILIALVVIIIVWWIRKRVKRNRLKNSERHRK